MPELTAVLEAATYAVFRFIRDEIEMEVESEADAAGQEIAPTP